MRAADCYAIKSNKDKEKGSHKIINKSVEVFCNGKDGASPNENEMNHALYYNITGKVSSSVLAIGSVLHHIVSN